MKTCMILEVNNKKAIVIFPDGEIREVRAKPGWKAGQTVSADKDPKKIKPLFVAAACLLLVFAVITPPAINMNTGLDDNSNNIAIGDPSVIASSVEKSDNDYKNVFDVLDTAYNDDLIVNYSEEVPPVESAPSPALSDEPLGLYDKGGSAAKSEIDSISDQGGNKEPAYSDTNIQVEGIQEADIIKTDGQYIYALNSKNLIILKANDGKPEIMAKIKQKDSEGQYFEMYIENGKLMAIRNTSDSDDGDISKMRTQVDIFDLTDPEDPAKIKSLAQSGRYVDSRMSGGYLYLISDYTPDRQAFDKTKPESFLPQLYNGDQKESVRSKDIVICPVNDSPSYTVMGSIDVSSAQDFHDTKSILSNTGEVYVSTENIYMTTFTDEYIKTKDKGITANTNSTQLTKLGYDKGKFGSTKTATIPGYVQGQFFMDEYNGTFRVVTDAYWDGTWNRKSETKPEGLDFDAEAFRYDGAYYVSGSYTALFTLDENLNEMGKIINIAPGEELYSCRFMDDYAYFVTFKQVDPLFTADLSDPKNPRLIGELKIPGFSEYMHPYDDGLLLGVGSDADEDTGMTGDPKLSMFDNSNPKKIKEKHTLIIGEYDYTEVADNHKAILVDSDKKLIAFPSGGTYLVFTYDKKDGFKQIAKMSYKDSYEYEYTENVIRGLFIDSSFYVITPNMVKTFDMDNDFKTIDKLKINTDAEPVYYDSYPYYGIIEDRVIIE